MAGTRWPPSVAQGVIAPYRATGRMSGSQRKRTGTQIAERGCRKATPGTVRSLRALNGVLEEVSRPPGARKGSPVAAYGTRVPVAPLRVIPAGRTARAPSRQRRACNEQRRRPRSEAAEECDACWFNTRNTRSKSECKHVRVQACPRAGGHTPVGAHCRLWLTFVAVSASKWRRACRRTKQALRQLLRNAAWRRGWRSAHRRLRGRSRPRRSAGSRPWFRPWPAGRSPGGVQSSRRPRQRGHPAQRPRGPGRCAAPRRRRSARRSARSGAVGERKWHR